MELSPRLKTILLHWSLDSTYMCCPVLYPQIIGGAFQRGFTSSIRARGRTGLPGVVTVMES